MPSPRLLSLASPPRAYVHILRGGETERERESESVCTEVAVSGERRRRVCERERKRERERSHRISEISDISRPRARESSVVLVVVL